MAQQERTALVAGGGIGGLTAALALVQRGWQVQVFERSASDRGGVALSLWPNAQVVLDDLGLAGTALAGAALAGRSGVRRPDGSWIAQSDIAEAVRARFGRPLVLVRRAELLGALRKALPSGCVRDGAKVTTVDPDRAQVTLASGGTVTGDVVVAADGMRSAVRARLFPDHPGLGPAGYTTWRMIAPAPSGGDIHPAETWGEDGLRFSVLPLPGNEIYSYATANHSGVLSQLFADWHWPIPHLIESAESIVRADVHELVTPLPRLHRGRVALAGDAAHPMTPDLGQGGGQAMEDGLTLAILLDRHADDVPRALAEYTAHRLARTTAIVTASRRAGALFQRSPRLARVAAAAMGRLPASVVARGLARTVDWRPPGGGR